MSKYIDADLYVEVQIYDDEHEEWGWWKGTIEDLLDQWTEEGCPTPIEVSEDCISREFALEVISDYVNYPTEGDKTCAIKNAPSVTPTERTGEWVNSKGEPVNDMYSVYCSRCKAWSEYRDIYCGSCGARMNKGGDTE